MGQAYSQIRQYRTVIRCKGYTKIFRTSVFTVKMAEILILRYPAAKEDFFSAANFNSTIFSPNCLSLGIAEGSSLTV